MVMATTDVAAPIEAARAKGKPSLLALNTLDDQPGSALILSTDTIEWSKFATQGLQGATTPLTNPNFPTTLLHDRNLNLSTQAAVGSFIGEPRAFLHIELDGGTDDEHTIDSIMIAHENLHLGPGTITVTVTVADGGNYDIVPTAPKFADAAVFTPTTGEKLIDLTLGDGDDQYTGVTAVRIKIETSTGDLGSFIPRISEIVLGKRRQLGHEPRRRGFDEEQEDSKERTLETDSGHQNVHVFATRRAVLNPMWLATDLSLSNIDSILQLRNWFKDSNGGTLKFLYIDKPLGDVSSLPGAHWMKAQPKLVQIAAGPNHRNSRIPMKEDTPFKSSEV